MGALQRKIFVIATLAVVVIISILLSYYYSVLKVQQDVVKNDVIHAANIRFDALQDAVEAKRDQVTVMAASDATHEALAALDSHFTFGAKTDAFEIAAIKASNHLRFLSAISNAEDVFLINKAGDVVLSLSQNPPYDHNLFESIFQNLGLARAAQAVLNGAQTTVSPFELRTDFGPKLANRANIPSAYFVAPIYDGEELLGALALQAWPENLYTITGNWRDILEGGVIALFAFTDSEVVLLNSLQPYFPLNAGETLMFNQFDNQGSVSRIVNGLSGYHLVNDIVYGLPRYEAYRSIPEMKLGFLISVPEQAVYDGAWQIVHLQIIVGAMVCVALLLFAFFTMRREGRVYATMVDVLREAYETGQIPVFPEGIKTRFRDVFTYLDGILRYEDSEKHKRERALQHVRTQEHAESKLLDAVYIKAIQTLEFAYKRNKVVLSDSDLRGRVEDTLGLSQQQIQEAISVLQEAKDLQNLLADELRIEHQRCNLIVFLSSVEEEYRLFASRSGRQFEMNLPVSIPEAVITDVKRLSQVFSALIDYAYSMSSNGRVEIHVDITHRTANNATFVFDIESSQGCFDTTLVSIIEKEFSVSLVDKVLTDCSGHLGMAVCKGLLAKMQANMWLSHKQDGASIKVVIDFNLA